MRSRIIILTLAFLSIHHVSSSQTVTMVDSARKINVHGFVVNERAEPVIANITVKKTNRVYTSNNKGEFNLQEVSEDAILLITGANIEKQEIKLAGRTVLNISTKIKIAEQQEVIITTNYYSTSKRLSTGNIVMVTSKEIGDQPVTSPLLALAGRVPGLEITPSSGAPGVAPKIRIRGTNSLRQNRGGIANSTASTEEDGNYPLYVIDGVPVNSIPFDTHFYNSFASKGYDPLSTINPGNIESIEILKDGDATAIYGSRGANGVILIKTKGGSKSSERTTLEFNSYTGIGQVAKQMRVLNRSEYLTMRREALTNDHLTPQQARAVDLYLWDTARSTNWQKVLLGGNSHINDIQLAISSGTKNSSFRFITNYHKETLLFPGDFGYRRISSQLSVNHTSTNQKFKMAILHTYGLDYSNFLSNSIVSSALTLPPNAPKLYNKDGSLNWEIHDVVIDGEVSTFQNPLGYLKNTFDADTRNNITNITLGYNPVEGLSVSINAGYTDILSKETQRIRKSSQSPVFFDNIRGINFTQTSKGSWIVEPKISYTRPIGQHKFNFIAGSTWQRNTNTSIFLAGDLYASDALLQSLLGAQRIRLIRDEATEYRYSSVYARLGYNWKEKYVLNITGRRDGSSRFGPGKRFGNFGSVGTAWIFSDEKFIRHALPCLSFGKFKASYGITGSDNIGDYGFYNLYTLTASKYGADPGVVPTSLFNPNYAWEITNKLETSLELSFLQNKIGIEINWYRNRSSNQLINYPLTIVTGFQSVQSNFAATVENSGWEAVINGNLLRSKFWQWNTSFNISIPRNKLIKFDGIEKSPYATIYKVGEPLSVLWYYTLIGVNKQTGLYNFVDQNGDGKINDDDRTLQNLAGNIYYGGLNNTIRYKNIEISFLFQYSHARSSRYLLAPPGSEENQPVEVLNRWQHSGDFAELQRFGNYITVANTYGWLQTSDYNSVDASFVRLQTLSLGYRIPELECKRFRLQELRLFLQVQNLLTLTHYKGLDPQTGSGLPPLRMITGGFQLKF